MFLPSETILQDRFIIQSLIAQGGMGAVYCAVDRQTGQRVAVKQNLRAEETLRAAFEREAALIARLSSPGLPGFVAAFDADETGQFLVTEYIDGPDLGTLLLQQPAPFPAEQVIAWGCQALDILAYLHGQEPPVLHRDIKPQNLKLDPGGRLVLLDFGIAKGSPAHTSLALSVAAFTLGYAPPEQIRGEGTQPASDLYALAATLYDLATLIRPADALRRMTGLLDGAPDPLVPPDRLVPGFPPALSAVLLKGMALKPEDRFASAQSFRAALEAALSAPTEIPVTQPPAWRPPSTPNNLPAKLGSFIGREKEVIDLRGWLRSADIRLVTITGPGGIGKTRLGIQAARDALDLFPGGVYFVELDAVFDPALLTATIARALGVKESADQSLLQSLIAFICQQPVLLVLDNFEQLVSAAPELTALIEACPNLKLLVTSRERLHLSGEWEYLLPPLQLPDPNRPADTQMLLGTPAVALFVERARASRQGWTPTREMVQAAAEICVLLDGLPLAIELAAARVRLLAPQAILADLRQRMRLLSGGPRDLPTRHQTIQASIDWSYALLTPAEQQLFRRLSVFVGMRTIASIMAVCDLPGDPALPPLEADLLDGLSSLVDKSLVQPVKETAGESHFPMLAVLHRYALERLQETDEYLPLLRRHADYFYALAQSAAPQLTGPEQAAWLARLEAWHDNFRQALRFCLETPDMRMTGLKTAAALWQFWEARGSAGEGRAWFDRYLSALGGQPSREAAEAWNAAGSLAIDQGDLAAGQHCFAQSKAYYDQFPDPAGAAVAYNGLGRVAGIRGEYELADRYYSQGLALCVETGDRARQMDFLNNIAVAAAARGDYARALDCFGQSLEISQALGNQRKSAYLLINLGAVAVYQEDYATAEAYHRRGLDLLTALGDRGGMAYALEGLAEVALKRGDYPAAQARYAETLKICAEVSDQIQIATLLRSLAYLALETGADDLAARLLGAEERHRERLNMQLMPIDVDQYTASCQQACGRLGEGSYQAAWQMGRSLTLDEVIALALQETQPPENEG